MIDQIVQNAPRSWHVRNYSFDPRPWRTVIEDAIMSALRCSFRPINITTAVALLLCNPFISHQPSSASLSRNRPRRLPGFPFCSFEVRRPADRRQPCANPFILSCAPILTFSYYKLHGSASCALQLSLLLTSTLSFSSLFPI